MPTDGEPSGDHEHEHSHGFLNVREWLAPHTHVGPDDALETSARGVRVLKISLAVLATTAVAQVLVVAVTGSVALLGDTLHNLADALTALPLWLAFTLGRRQPTRRFTYGYGRAEDLAGVFIVLMITLSAGVAGYESIRRMIEPAELRNVPAVMVAALAGFAGNELVALYRIRVGREIGSASLVADGLHARADGLTSLAVLAGAIGVAAGWDAADPVAGLVITLAILFVLRSAARDVYRRLMDAVDPETVELAERVVAQVPGVERLDHLRLRWIGHRLYGEADITVDADLGVADAHEIAVEAHHALLHEVRRLTDAVIHVNPCDHGGIDPHAATSHHR